jgi:Na+-translocating ferredoxin:NAD+ oxidoreductase RnfE subunit
MTEVDLPPVLRWLRLAALSPLLALATSSATAVAVALAMTGTLVFTAAIAPVLRKHLPDSQRPIALALVAAVIATALDLLLQAFSYEGTQPLHDWLPLLAVLPVLFDRTGDANATLASALRTALLRAVAFSAGLLAGAMLRSILPSEAGIAICLIWSGLALALIARFAPSRPVEPGREIPVARTRARVTGPLR